MATKQEFQLGASAASILGVDKEVWWRAHDLLVGHYGMLHYLPGVLPPATEVLHRIAARGAQFGKVGDVFGVRSLRAGVPAALIPGLPLSIGWIHKQVSILVATGFVFRVARTEYHAALLGLHMPAVLKSLSEWVRANSSIRLVRKYAKMPEHVQELDAVFHPLQDVYDWMRDLPIQNDKEFLVSLQERVDQAKQLSASRVRSAALVKVGNTPHSVAEDGTVRCRISSTAIIRAWTEHLRLLKYPVASSHSTKKAMGMAKRWAQELTDVNFTPEDINKRIEYIVTNWRRILPDTITTANDKKIDIRDVPDFEFYYMHRAALDSKLYAIEKDRERFYRTHKQVPQRPVQKPVTQQMIRRGAGTLRSMRDLEGD